MEKQKNQIIFIRGGETFNAKDDFYNYLKNVEFDPYKQRKNWRDWLAWSLSDDFDAITPNMPNKQWADYEAWKIWFERLFPYINKDKKLKLILIGNSLGTIFLAKYLSENKMPKKVDQLHLVAPLFNNEGLYSEEQVGSFEFVPNNLNNVEKQVDKIFLYASTDDPFIALEGSKKFMDYFKKAEFFTFENRGHFSQPAFIEVLETINKNL